jgi:fatty acid CoA ligase FadD36
MGVLGELTGGSDTVAVQVAERTLRRSELLAAAAVVAERVHGARVAAIAADASLETVVAVVGCLLAGVVGVPVAHDSGPAERSHLLADSGAELWLGGGAGDDSLLVVPVDPSERTTSTWTEPADGVALLMYTSGTTGAPKGVPVSRAAMRAGVDGLQAAWDWSSDDVLVHGLPLFHVHGLILGLIGALRVGSPVIHTVRPTPAAYAGTSGSLYFGVPTVWGRIAADPPAARALLSARLLVSGSAGLPAPVFAALAELAGQGPVERYGMTETLITLAARADEGRRSGWVGRPIASVAARLIDDAGDPVPADGETIGNLQVAGPTVFAGYHDRPEASADCFTPDGWFRTGDAAIADDSGQYRIVGRARDDLIKSGGYRIGAGEVESALLGHPGVTEAAVIGVPDDDLGQRIVAYVVGSGVGERELIDHVAGELSVHKRPREVRIVAALPRNALGKVQKAALRREYR